MSVVGDYNDWRPGVHALTPRKDGNRAVTVELPTGRSHSFRYLAADPYGVHLIRHARGVMVGWPNEDISPPPRRRGPCRSRRPSPHDLPGLRHAFGLAMAAALRPPT
ncbi:hypothetical protein ACH4TC_39500 [Streptomyces spororaveus]|uniref:hypothetical protein n=1 Tax=Streptomyces spororaveus TaxID=284039 RepID=UPI0037B89A71